MPGVEHCLQQAMTIPGAVGASIVDYTTGFPIATAGAAPNSDHDAAAAGTAEVVQAATSRSLLLSALPNDLLEDLIITTAGGYHLLRPVQTDFDSRLVLYLWLDRAQGNLAVARRRLEKRSTGKVGLFIVEQIGHTVVGAAHDSSHGIGWCSS